MSTKKMIAIGCIGLTVFGCVIFAAIAAFIGYVGQGVKDATVTVNVPAQVAKGETFTLEVVVANNRNKAMTIGDVDLATDYLDGFVVVSTDPKYSESTGVPIVGAQSFTFASEIPANSEKTFTFTLLAVTPGYYRGDVDAYEGLKVITTLAQTVVTEADGATSVSPSSVSSLDNIQFESMQE